MVGLIDDVRRVLQPGFKSDGDIIALLGVTNDDLSISEFSATVLDLETEEMISQGAVPSLDLDRELAVQAACLEAVERDILQSAHDCSDGGLAVSLAESCFSTLARPGIGAQIDLDSSLPNSSLLFSESPSRIIVSFAPGRLTEISLLAKRLNCPFRVLGRVGGDRLQIKIKGIEAINLPVDELEAAWSGALPQKLASQFMAAARE
jgi:phosphoribosylformylglycinamidine synthase